MTFYDQCINLRDDYLKHPEENHLKICILSKLYSIAFFHPESTEYLDNLPIGVQLSIDFSNELYDVETSKKCLTKVLEDLGYSSFFIEEKYYHLSDHLGVTIN